MLEIQRRVAERVRLEPLEEPPERVAGVDVSYRGDRYRAAAVVVDADTLKPLETRTAEGRVRRPYEPGFLAFREGPPALKVLKGLDYDLLLVNGHGIAHPRRAGLASHLGVALDRPTVGVARRPLVGRPLGEPERVGDAVPLFHRGEKVGHLVLTRPDCRPLVVSPGHRCSHRDAVEWVLRLVRGGKWPEPLRLADRLSKRWERG